VDKRTWLITAAGFSFFMAAGQAAIAVSPTLAAYFQAPPGLLENRWRLLIIGGGAAFIPVVFGLYALSGAGIIGRLPLLRSVLIAIGALFLLRGLFIVLTVLELLGVLPGRILVQGVLSHLVFLAAGIAFSVGTALNWSVLSGRE
jgi:hypothetical protein